MVHGGQEHPGFCAETSGTADLIEVQRIISITDADEEGPFVLGQKPCSMSSKSNNRLARRAQARITNQIR